MLSDNLVLFLWGVLWKFRESQHVQAFQSAPTMLFCADALDESDLSLTKSCYQIDDILSSLRHSMLVSACKVCIVTLHFTSVLNKASGNGTWLDLAFRLLMPLICKDMVDLLDKRNTSALNHSSLSDYAFLYGVFPTAPSVAIYAVYYNAELEVVSSLQLPANIPSTLCFLSLTHCACFLCSDSWQVTAGMVISTFLSAPIMYVSAWLLTIRWTDPQRLMNSLQNVSFNISIVSLVALVSPS